ncbi:anti-sigma-F factor Fin [Anaeroselena agilis]|uniref:DUF2757 family protein n=1 Tax=Anaeroselena agilis TaxID=3063788 RepID=A0ABU3P180_9FIRM|nr:DUF2757 family protein [Selenomonadales bacterium 4137-cl]
MRIHYSCDNCGEPIDTIEVTAVDEERFGFDCLTAEERQEIIRYDEVSGVLYVQSLCDACIEAMGLPVVDMSAAAAKFPLH